MIKRIVASLAVVVALVAGVAPAAHAGCRYGVSQSDGRFQK